MFWKVPTVVGVVALVAAAAALGSSGLSSATSVAVIAGKPSEFRFTLSKKTVPKGAVVFKVTNRGTTAHDFRIAGKKTKLLRKGASTTLTAALSKPGKYPFLCTVPGHAAGGMKGTLTVT